MGSFQRLIWTNENHLGVLICRFPLAGGICSGYPSLEISYYKCAVRQDFNSASRSARYLNHMIALQYHSCHEVFFIIAHLSVSLTIADGRSDVLRRVIHA